MLKLVGITKDYKVADSYVHALKGVDLSFRKNEFVSILGQSGCGKTTLLNIIGGLDQYTAGDLIIKGKSTKNFSDHDWDVYRNHKIGFIFQSYNLIPHQTVLGNVEIALTIAGVSKEERKRRATEALARVGLGEELFKRPNQLSGGQMQRVAIARALVNDPDILLADEPTGALDSQTSVQIMDLIREISGERLVIMVTHNPDLAEQYSNRIIRLSDGLVVSDSNPYEGEEVAIAPVSSKEKKKKKGEKASMGFLTSLTLSARNLLTKKGRTVITSLAGSIGIISVCLVLALSNGFSNYIRKTEEDMLSYYPVQVTESTLDITSVMASVSAASTMPNMSEIGDKVYVDSFLTSIGQGLSVRNNISAEYISYIEGMPEEYYAERQYGYGVSFTDNLFTEVVTGRPSEMDGLFPEKQEVMSLSALKAFYISELNSTVPEYSSLVPFAEFFGDIVNAMPGTGAPSEDGYGEYVQSQYSVIAGTFPQSVNEAVLVVGPNNEVTDLTLAQLGLLEETKFLELFQKGDESDEDTQPAPMEIDFNEVLGKQYFLYHNDYVYSQNAEYNPMTVGSYPFIYNGRKEGETLNGTEEQGISIRISGILRLKEGLTYGCLTEGLNLIEKTVNDYIVGDEEANIRGNQNSQIVEWIKASSAAFGYPDIYIGVPSENLASYYQQRNIDPTQSISLLVSDDSSLRHVGGENAPNKISLFARDFESKEDMLGYLDAWNEAEGREKEDEVKYSDTVGVLMGLVQTILNAVTYVLVAFTAISLVVSSVMIGIITYVSVVERVKEIGVLRSLGARKRDIRNLFNAETFIIGLAAGLFGVVVTYLISLVVNCILQPLTGIAGLAALPVSSALVMVLVSVMLTLISGLIPASAAAKKDPVIALRTE